MSELEAVIAEEKAKLVESKKLRMLYLDEEDMIEAGVMDAAKCVDVMEETMGLLEDGDFIMGGPEHNSHGIMLEFPKKSDIDGFPINDGADRRFIAMPAYLGGKFHVAGCKWYGSNGNNRPMGIPRSNLMFALNDVETGQPLAYMSANLLSAMRTGAVPGVVAKHLSVKNPKVLTLLGPGVVNKTCLMAYMSQFDSIDTIKIKGSSAASATAKEMERFIKEKYPQISHIVLCGTDEEAVKDADIISEATSVEKRRWPVLKPEWIKPGCLIISSGTMDFSDYDFMVKDIRKIVDIYPMYEEYIEIYEEWDENGKRLSSGIPGMYYVNMVDDGKIALSPAAIQNFAGR